MLMKSTRYEERAPRLMTRRDATSFLFYFPIYLFLFHFHFLFISISYFLKRLLYVPGTHAAVVTLSAISAALQMQPLLMPFHAAAISTVTRAHSHFSRARFYFLASSKG